MKALLVIDMINDFVSPYGSMHVPGVEIIIPKIVHEINTGIDQLIIFCNDAHVNNDPEFKQWPRHAVFGSWGAQTYPELYEANGSPLYLQFGKQKYSAFTPTLLAFLGDMHITQLRICGVVTEYCILHTSLDALKCGYQVEVLRDKIKGLDAIEARKALDKIIKVGGKIV